MREPAATLLLVDDNRGFRDVFVAVLEDSDPAFRVHTVETATQAVAFLARRPPYAAAPHPHFVVLDFHLPDFNAPRLLRTLASRAALHGVPVLVLSQADWPEDHAAVLRAGAAAFAVKPSHVDALHRVVASFWQIHVAARRARA